MASSWTSARDSLDVPTATLGPELESHERFFDLLGQDNQGMQACQNETECTHQEQYTA